MQQQQYLKIFERVCQRYAPSRILSFNIAHIFKTLQLIEFKGHVSRDTLCKELKLGEGTVKTLIKHLKMNNLIKTSNSGTIMTLTGNRIFKKILENIPKEMELSKCSVALGRYNYSILLKQYRFAIESGIDQRDYAIKFGALGATTLIFNEFHKFIIPKTDFDALEQEDQIYQLIVNKLEPTSGDVVIIGSDNADIRIAELAAKYAGLLTIMNHDKYLK